MADGDAPMDVLAAIMTRRSVGDLRADPVAREVIAELIAAACRAPNHHLSRPWRFVVLAGDARRELGRVHAAAVARVEGVLDDRRRAREEARLERAPVVVACLCAPDPDADPVTAREDRDAVAAGIQNLLLAAHAHGLGAIWRTGAMVDEVEVRANLGLREGDAIVGFVYLGHPSVTPPTRRPRADGGVEWRWADEA